MPLVSGTNLNQHLLHYYYTDCNIAWTKKNWPFYGLD
jgi:hypothetical protein